MIRFHNCWVLLAGVVCAFLIGCENTGAAPSRSTALAPAAHGGGAHLAIRRAANFGGGLGVVISVDGVQVALLRYGEDYNGTLAPGPRVITAMAYPNYLFLQPTVKHINAVKGQSYFLTLSWLGERMLFQ